MTDQLWFDPRFGASGNMVLGCFISLGVEPALITSGLASLGVEGIDISATTVRRGSLRSTHAAVAVQDSSTHRSWSEIDQRIADSELPVRVRDGARQTFRRLAEVEADIHDVPVTEVHFHEVGALDAIADIVGSWISWNQLAQPEVTVGSFGLGHGTVEAAHGTLPLPAPAVVELLLHANVHPLQVAMETVTPTGAAILMSMATGFRPGPPAGSITATGRGAGGRDPTGYPNVLTAIRLTSPQTAPSSASSSMMELSTNLDDVTAEVLAHTVARCLEAGAADAWVTPIVMKKGRPGHLLSVLCQPSDTQVLCQLVMTETGTLGVRLRSVDRVASERSFETVLVEGHQIRIKLGPLGAKPEFEDLVTAAKALGSTPRAIGQLALLRFSE
ncbi:MAG: nickel pincer cofactor biosynthesis protein LarC [Acidimicrobiales bacterium]|nr:nickel pincer cofactor biosynthesis protein LarC [Acidimicrobiales bacterium]